MIADMKDRNVLNRSLQLRVHPFDMTSHGPSVLMNVYTGEFISDKSNVHKLFEIGNKKMKKYQESLPDGLYATLSEKGYDHGQRKDKGTSN